MDLAVLSDPGTGLSVVLEQFLETTVIDASIVQLLIGSAFIIVAPEFRRPGLSVSHYPLNSCLLKLTLMARLPPG